MIRSEEIGKERKKRTRKIVDFDSFVRAFLLETEYGNILCWPSENGARAHPIGVRYRYRGVSADNK